MKAIFLSSFLKDVKKLRNAKLQNAVAETIRDVEAAASIDGVRSIKRLSGHREYYRIRIGDWRIGIKIEGQTVLFVRCLNRKEVYRCFP